VIGKWLKGRYTKRVVEDKDKIAALLRLFNGGSTGPWIATEGFNIMLGFEFGKNGQANTIKGGEGVVVKVFLNSETGEARTVIAQAVTKNG